jgi:hypothetical protein
MAQDDGEKNYIIDDGDIEMAGALEGEEWIIESYLEKKVEPTPPITPISSP